MRISDWSSDVCSSDLAVVVVVETFDGGLLDRAVHPLDLAIRPGMLHLGQPVLDGVVAADAVKDVLEGMPVLLAVGELDAVVGEHGVRSEERRVGKECVSTCRSGVTRMN